MFRTTTTPSGLTRICCARCGVDEVLPPSPAGLARWKAAHTAACPVVVEQVRGEQEVAR